MALPKICTPAMVYLAISILSTIIIILQGSSAISVIFNALFVLAWTWFLNFLCLKGHTGISWFLVILPFLFFLAALAIAVEVLVNSNSAQAPTKKTR